MKTYRVGLIGFGFIGKVHAYGYANLPLYYSPCDFRAEITHVCTSRPETAAKAKEILGERVTGVCDFRQITENPEVDVVDICTPNHLHCEELLSAIAHNKNIYCDKPLTATLAQARQVQQALKSYKAFGQMTFQNRFFPAALRAKQLMEAGAIGEVLEFSAFHMHSGSVDPNTPLKWKLSGEAGGGVVADLGSHILDLMEHLMGPFCELSAATRILYPQRPDPKEPGRMRKVEAEDNMFVTARLANGALGTITASKIATGAEDELSFTIHGSKGALRLNGGDWFHLYYYDGNAAGAPIGGLRGWTAIDCGQRYEAPGGGFPSAKSSIGWMRSHVHCIYTFLNSIYLGKQLGPSLEHGVHIQYLLDKIRQSAADRTWVTL